MCEQVVYEQVVCEDKLCVMRTRDDGRRREEADGGIQTQKQEPHTKMWGKTHLLAFQCACQGIHKADLVRARGVD